MCTSTFSHCISYSRDPGILYSRDRSPRYSPASNVGQMYMTKLKYLIEETYELNSDNRVMLIAHSMGNPYLVNFLTQSSQVRNMLHFT